jgi:hypothetical protein
LPQGAYPQTFQTTPGVAPNGTGGTQPSAPETQTELKAVPDSALQNGSLQNGGSNPGGSNNNSAIAPRWADPRNRTALRPSGETRSFNVVSRVVDLRGVPQSPPPSAPAIDFGGWRASKR